MMESDRFTEQMQRDGVSKRLENQAGSGSRNDDLADPLQPTVGQRRYCTVRPSSVVTVRAAMQMAPHLSQIGSVGNRQNGIQRRLRRG